MAPQGPVLSGQPVKLKDGENEKCLGGMRNPHVSASKLPRAAAAGKAVRGVLTKAQELWPALRGPASRILEGAKPGDLDGRLVDEIRKSVLTVLGASKLPKRVRSAKASSPISSEVLAAWGKCSGDPDAGTLADWIDKGAPLGFTDLITSNGVFPAVDPVRFCPELYDPAPSLEGWTNYKSAEDEKEDLDKLVNDYVSRGFCRIIPTMDEAVHEYGRQPVINKLGVVVKHNEAGAKKSRIIWDLKQSQANVSCHQGERIVLPRLTDLATSACQALRAHQQAWVLALDVRDAFLNIPAGKDRFMTLAAKPDEDGNNVLIAADTLVFGAKSSPTIWGRYAALLGRSWASIEPSVQAQIYVDDPAAVAHGPIEEAVTAVTNLLLWAAVAGYPLKLEKSEGGKSIKWIGATILVDEHERAVVVSIPADKRRKLLEACRAIAAKPVVSAKALTSFTGGLSFVAGLIPHLRPFLDSFWAVLADSGRRASAGDGVSGPSGKLIHVQRIQSALQWVAALLRDEDVPLKRIFYTKQIDINAEITTDASPWGIGGVLRLDGKLTAAFSLPLEQETLVKFRAAKGDPKHTTLWEGLALLVAFRLWLPRVGFGASIRVKSDSLSSLIMLSKGRAKSPELNIIAREVALDQALLVYRLTFLEHIPGVTNLEADYLSRAFAPKVPVKPRQLEGVPLTPFKIGAGFWKVTKLT